MASETENAEIAWAQAADEADELREINAELLTELASAALALEEAAKLLHAKGLQGTASIIAGHADRARAAIAKATSHATTTNTASAR